MPDYLAPGVYVEESPTGPRSIEGVSTSTAGFVGETERGPEQPTLVTSWQDYSRRFGGYLDQPPFGASGSGSPNLFLPYAVRGFFDNGGKQLWVARIVGAGSVAAAGQLPGPNGPIIFRAMGPGRWGNNVVVLASQASAALGAPAASPAANWFRLRALYYRNGVPHPLFTPGDPARLSQDPDLFEDFDNLTADTTESNNLLTVVNGSSHLIQLESAAGPPDAPAPPASPVQVTLSGGITVDAGDQDYLDEIEPGAIKGLPGIGQLPDVALVAIPDAVLHPELIDPLIDQCEKQRDRLAILSVAEGVTDLATLDPPRNSAFGAFYYPWIRVEAPHLPLGHRLIPPTGHIAGIYARVDQERGVHKAPANELVRGISTSDLLPDYHPLEVTLDHRQQDLLNPRGVNVIRDFHLHGRGIRVWGARTMTSDPEWKYVNVRRLAIFIEQSIERGIRWAVFEPNAEPTWSAIRASIGNFLRTVWRNGALAGSTEKEAFFVKCDRTTMTQSDLDNGRLACLVGIAPIQAAEFVIFRISQKMADANS